MAISFSCDCGQTLEVDDDLAGRKVSCPTCSRVLEAPAAKRPRPRAAKAAVAAPPPAAEESDRPRKRRRRPDDDIRDPAVREMMRKARAENHEDMQARKHLMRPRDTGWRHLTRTATGSIVAMVIAVVWFVAGLFGGVIFFFPPILFVFGFVGLIRSLYGNNDD